MPRGRSESDREGEDGVSESPERSRSTLVASERTATINLDIRDSVPDWSPYLPPKAPDGAPNVLTSPGTTSATGPWTCSAAR